jgi:hypothetical protein
MKTLILSWTAGLLALLAWPKVVCGDVYVCGNVINQTWIKADSPYRVTCDAVVSGLSIEPGVSVLFETNCVFRVAGRLTAIGTAAEPIVFTRTNGPGGWQGVFFNQNPAGSELAYCVISQSTNSGVRIYRATPTIRNCIITDNGSPSVGGGIVITNDSLAAGDVNLRDCVISSNVCLSSGGGIFAIMGGNTLTLEQCDISMNEVNRSHVTVRYASGGGVSLSGNARLLDSSLTNNRCNAVYSGAGGYARGGGADFQAGLVLLVGSTISRNLAWGAGDCTGIGGGIAVTSGELRQTNCVFLANALRPNSNWTVGGSGLHVAGASTHVSLVNSVLAHNTNSISDIRGSGVSVAGGTVEIANCTIAFNDECGFYLSGGAATIRNSIIYFNERSPDLSGTATVTYSCVGGGYAGEGNISLEPFFTSPTDFILFPYSPCIDAGDPSPADNDACFPPSLGSVTNDMGAYGGPFACLWPTTPRILVQPTSQNTCLGKSATFCVQAWGQEPLAYQWFYNSNAVAGATNSCLTVPVTDTNQAGIYFLVVTNGWGAVTSEVATLTISPACLSIALYPGLTVNGEVGRDYTIEWASGLEEPVYWHALTNFTLSTPEVLWFDPTPAGAARRFYRIKP